MALRFLYAFKFNIEQSFDALKSYYVWHSTEIPKALKPNLVKSLENGFLRVFGRDKYYRPILIVKPDRALGDVRTGVYIQ